MAVLVEALSIIIRMDALDRAFVDPEDVEERANASYCTDGRLIRVGFLVTTEAEAFGGWLESQGLVFVEDGAFKDFAVVDQFDGPAAPCPWLFLGEHFAARCKFCELVGTQPPYSIAIPQGWQPGNSQKLSRGPVTDSTDLGALTIASGRTTPVTQATKMHVQQSTTDQPPSSQVHSRPELNQSESKLVGAGSADLGSDLRAVLAGMVVTLIVAALPLPISFYSWFRIGMVIAGGYCFLLLTEMGRLTRRWIYVAFVAPFAVVWGPQKDEWIMIDLGLAAAGGVLWLMERYVFRRLDRP